jgi:hypothetical protein
MKKGLLKPYQEIIKENIDIMMSFSDVETKVSMAEEIIYSIIKMSAGSDLLLETEMIKRTLVAIVSNNSEADS